jgi:SAM-dependent methyltransferase
MRVEMADFGLPPSDEPFDFRRQAAFYGRYRRGYSPALFDTIEARAGRAAGRRAIDLGCGTGLVAAELTRRGWHTAGIDFSASMLREGRNVHLRQPIRARGEALPLRDECSPLVACGTAFHWIAPAPGIAEIARVLVPGGWTAFFWRYAVRGQAHMAMVAETLARFGGSLAQAPLPLPPCGPEVFDGSRLVADAPVVLRSVLAFTADEFHGYVSTVEWIRRLAGERHGAFLADLRAEVSRRYPAGVREESEEYLLLARKP